VEMCAQGRLQIGHIYSANLSIGQPFPSTIYLLFMLFTA